MPPLSTRGRVARALVVSCALLATACADDSSRGSAVASDSAAATVAAPDTAAGGVAPASPAAAVPVGPTAELPPNELGEILVLEYHRLGETETEYVRREENFRRDLQELYRRGYRPITMRQLLSGDVDLPAGTTPVVFTIDDASRGQFYYLEDGSIDPHTMVGMWDAFRTENPAWSNGAVWCVLPAADFPSNFFGEAPSREVPREEREATIARKVRYLIDTGHEICNHTLYHARLDRARDDAQVQEWIGRGEDSIRVYLPDDYDIVTFSLPLGVWPKTKSLAWRGEWNGRPYEYEAVLEVAGGPSVSIYDRDFDPHSIDRFIVAPGHLEQQLEQYERRPETRFVSDGDPRTISVPAALADRVARERWPRQEVRRVETAAGRPRE